MASSGFQRSPNGSGWLDALALDNRIDSVARQPGQFIHDSAGPVHLDVGPVCLSEAEVHSQIVLRDIAAAAANFVHLSPRAGHAVNPSPDSRPVRFRSEALDLDPAVLLRRIASP